MSRGPIFIALRIDDSVLFFKEDMIENWVVMELLEFHEQASDLQINKSKTSISFSGNITPLLKGRIKNFWGVSSTPDNALYLGLPQIIGRAKPTVFLEIKQRVWKNFQG